MDLNINTENAFLHSKYTEKCNIKHDQKHFDSGFDLFCPTDMTIGAGEIGVPINLQIKCSAYYFGTCNPSPYYLYPRSSISKTPLRLANSVGIIDSGYRGNIIAVVDNVGSSDYTVSQGQRLFQLCAPNLQAISPKIVNNLTQTYRGAGGFGSTGKN